MLELRHSFESVARDLVLANRRTCRYAHGERILLLCGLVTCLRGYVSEAFVVQNRPSIQRQYHGRLQQDLQSMDALSVGKEKLQPYFSFSLDDWQLEAGGEILKGNNVILCAPTGAGKTVVGEMALHMAVESGANAIYTTPLKALSNQKFAELRQIFGKANVGLSTGDMSINRGARVTVMTTEVYRNIAWRSSGSRRDKERAIVEDDILHTDELESNAVVVLDEFHYMGQPGRGGVWEECVITSPAHTQIVGLSATLPNAMQLASWIEGVTGRKTVLVQAQGGRPVPLRYLFATREGLYPLFRDPDAGPGAPKGLLGLRGDGKPTTPTKKRGGFKNEDDVDDDVDEAVSNKVPRGLQINPALKTAADRRMQRVNRAIDRQKARDTFQRDDGDWEVGQKSKAGRRVQGKLSVREERRERERLLRSEMRKAVPSLSVLLRRLEQKSLLPAIFFIFSRAGCDEAAATVCQFMKGPREIVPDLGGDDDYKNQGRNQSTRQRGNRYDGKSAVVEDASGRSFRKGSNYVSDDVLTSVFESEFTKGVTGLYEADSPLSPDNWNFYASAGLLSLSEIEEVAGRVANFNEANEEIAFDDNAIERFLFGVGSHHAGMLAAHKALVESLYRAQLMKVVFATETLAAGINMPARTTVICALAKRGDGSSMNLLETSNLLQMAGRAGRRGMDTDGTCVILATPFEGHDDAALILTDEIKPIVSQFSPSYALAINLIARGNGKLDVARQLVQKSFAMWEKRQIENSIASTVEMHGDSVSEVLEIASQERFLTLLVEAFQFHIDRKSAKFDIARMQSLLDILSDRDVLKRTSKSYAAASKILEIERTTMEYLEREKDAMSSFSIAKDDDLIAELLAEDQSEICKQIETQRKRVEKTEKELSKHPFTTIAMFANEIMSDNTYDGKVLHAALQSSRSNGDVDSNAPVTADELPIFAKSAIVKKRKARKLEKTNPDIYPVELIEKSDKAEAIGDDTWEDMLALTRVLVAYGCLTTEASADDSDATLESQSYQVTPAGVNIGMIGLENSLWGLVAMGGAWDVAGVSAKLDDFKAAMKEFDEDFYDLDSTEPPSSEPESLIPTSQEEAVNLINQLRSLTPSELAGYVSCLVSEGSRGGTPSIVESFQRLSPRQQRVVQSSLLVLERLMEVQKDFSVDESSRRCTLELSNCEVVTAWAAGCTWNEAIEMSGAAPGDLVRTLSRALDALRQFGNLPFTPIRAADMNGGIVKKTSDGIHAEVRRLCRDAAKAINRYPVKDPLPFEAEDIELDDELDEATTGDDLEVINSESDDLVSDRL